MNDTSTINNEESCLQSKNSMEKWNRTTRSARILSSTDQRQHWWKVCWFYDNRNVFLNTNGNKYATLPSKLSKSNRYRHSPIISTYDANYPAKCHYDSMHMSLMKKKSRENGEQESNRKIETNSSSSIISTTNEQSTKNMFNEDYSTKMALTRSTSTHNSLDDITTNLVNKSKSMANRAQMFTLPRLIENNVHKEMAKFYNQQYYVTQLISNKIAQPIAAWTKINQNRIINFLIEYKGSAWRDNQLQFQMPNQDEQFYSQQTTESKFIRNRRRKALIRTELFLLTQQNEYCQKCKLEISAEIHCVKIILSSHNNHNNNNESNGNSSSSSTSNIKYYHIDCFTCTECKQILVDLKAYINPILNVNQQKSMLMKNNFKDFSFNLYCSRHFVELFKPRCPSCDKLIFDEECTEAEGKAWHIGHFCCNECKRSLGGQQYIMAQANNNNNHNNVCDDKNLIKRPQMPYCLTCFDILFGELCEECGELIGCEVGAIVHDGRSWHANERCFRCSLCMKNLLGKPFLPALDGRIYCSIACSQAMVAHRKKRLKKQNKLQTLHANSNGKQQSNDNRKMVNENELIVQNDKIVINPETVKKKCYSEEKFNSQDKMKELNLNQMIDYVEFIKKNNQCFTSKYDWSKEQEFLSVVDSSNDVSSQTTSTSDHTCEDNFIQQFNIRCDLNEQLNKTNLNADWPYASIKSAKESGHYSNVKQACSNKIAPLMTSNSSSQSNNDTPQANLFYSGYNHLIADNKNITMNSPTLSYEQASSTISPPPEYSNIDNNEENSSNCSFQNNPNTPTHWSKENKINDNIKSNINSFKTNENRHNLMNLNEKDLMLKVENFDNKIISNGVHYSSTPVIGQLENFHPKNQLNNNTSKSKSVSFDPNIKDKNETKRTVRRKSYRTIDNNDDYSDDTASCSSCSTCSSSSDDDFDYEQDFLANINQNKNTNKLPNRNQTNDACIIS